MAKYWVTVQVKPDLSSDFDAQTVEVISNNDTTARSDAQKKLELQGFIVDRTKEPLCDYIPERR